MRFVTFWKIQSLELSLTERMFFRDAIRTLQAWEIINKEFAELDLVKKILEADINILPVNPPGEEANNRSGNLQTAEYRFIRDARTS